MNDNTALARATGKFPTLAKWAQKYNACLIFRNRGSYKMGVMFGDPTTSPGGDSPKFYASVRIKLGGGQLKEGGDRVGQLVKSRVRQNKVAPPFQKCEWNFYFDPSRGLDVVESLVEYMLDGDTFRRRPPGASRLATRSIQSPRSSICTARRRI